MEFLAKGHRNPNEYFNLFRNSVLVGKDSHTWFRNKVVTLFNDHDQVSKGADKARFCADANAAKLVLNALALNVFTRGIPCIYYGTEQSLTDTGEEMAQTATSGRPCLVVNSVPTKANMSTFLTKKIGFIKSWLN
jgi:hypothetical protein